MDLNEFLVDQISSKQKGNITENRVVELITLGSKGRLTCYTPNSDDDGIDIIVNQKGQFKSLYIQVKSRYTLNKANQFIQNVGLSTFNIDVNFYIIFVYFNPNTLEIESLWFVPSVEFKDNSYLKKAGDTYKPFYRFSANPRVSLDKWEQYKVHKTQLGMTILEMLLT